MPAFYLKTFGCKTNQYESQGIREALLGAGLSETDAPTQAEILIINTCVVTGKAGQDCRNYLLRAREENPRLRVFITGCAVDVSEPWLRETTIEAVFKNNEKSAIVAAIVAALTGKIVRRDDTGSQNDNRGFDFSLQGFQEHTRAFIKIQDGCNNFCSYCIIPRARGLPRSRPVPDILAEVARLLENGYREFVLTGINIGAYSRAGMRLPELTREIAQLPGLRRLRLGSIEPPYLSDELLRSIAESPRICPHLHLPLQAGADTTLHAMNRKYSVRDFLARLESARKILDRPAITTDIIVGFPGESAQDFTQTMHTAEAAGFARIHVFSFSPRPGTPASDMPPCPKAEINTRRRELAALGEDLAAAYAASLRGMRESVIIEHSKSGKTEGYCARYLRTRLPDACGLRPGDMGDCIITASSGGELRAELA